MHLKECDAIAYFQFLVNRKHEKRCEFFHSYLHYGASYAPAASGVWKKGYPGCMVRKFSVVSSNPKTLFLYAF
jgi:hypothetical protein